MFCVHLLAECIPKSYSNENTDSSYTKINSTIEDNLLERETFPKAFYRFHNNGAFTDQLKVQGDENKQTKFLDEFLVYPLNESMAKMNIAKHDEFFFKEMEAIKKYFSDVIVLSAVVHRDEVFYPKDEETKALYPTGKITPHMHLIVITVYMIRRKIAKEFLFQSFGNRDI